LLAAILSTCPEPPLRLRRRIDEERVQLDWRSFDIGTVLKRDAGWIAQWSSPLFDRTSPHRERSTVFTGKQEHRH
jgi:hypothetical protein